MKSIYFVFLVIFVFISCSGNERNIDVMDKDIADEDVVDIDNDVMDKDVVDEEDVDIDNDVMDKDVVDIDNDVEEDVVDIDNDVEDDDVDEGVAVCEEGEFKLFVCGYNENGERKKICEDGDWVEGECIDPDECKNDTIISEGDELCGYNEFVFTKKEICEEGKIIQRCINEDRSMFYLTEFVIEVNGENFIILTDEINKKSIKMTFPFIKGFNPSVLFLTASCFSRIFLDDDYILQEPLRKYFPDGSYVSYVYGNVYYVYDSKTDTYIKVDTKDFSASYSQSLKILDVEEL